MTQIALTKPVCQLDADGLYLGQTEAELDVYARDGSYLIPGGCIDTTPPEARDGYVARWTGEKWEYISDFRGQIAYRKDTGEKVLITQIGELSVELTLEPRPSEAHEWQGDTWVATAARAAEVEAKKLSEAKSGKLVELTQAAQSFVNAAADLDSIPDFEMQTWPIQAAEAQAWAADLSAATPILDRIAAARGVEPEKLKAAALRKALAYSALSAHVAGQRQALQSKIEAAKTVAELDKIKIEFTAPETV